jgi:hypothetical protein
MRKRRSGATIMAKSSKKAPRKTAKKTATRAAGGGPDLRRHIVARAAADPAFRRRLFADPAAVFGGRLTASDKAAVERMKRMMPALEGIVSSLAGEVLCGGGGGCGGLA